MSEFKTDTLGEASPLLCDTVERRPYQAYCATEISSCPPSPDILVPSPLRIRKVHSQQADTDTQATDTDASEQNTSLVHAATFSLDKHFNFARVFTSEKYRKKQTKPTNQNELLKCTASATADHIAPPPTPRGSHLAVDNATVYHQAPSRPRMQQLEYIDCSPERSIPRKPVPRNGWSLGSSYRPLPAVPFEDVALENLNSDEPVYEDENLEFQLEKPTLAGERLEVQDGQAASKYSKPIYNNSHEPLLDPCDHTTTATVEPELVFKEPFSILGSTLCSPHVRESRPAVQSRVCDQPPLPTELHMLHNPSSDTDTPIVPQRAHSKDKDLRYQPEQLPSRISRLQSPSNHDTHITPFDSPTLPLRHPAPSFHSYLETHNGPRPPPWGSYDTLALQRRERSAYRERAQHLVDRFAADTMTTTTPFYPKSLSTHSLHTDPSREVQEYREQILSVYPDMAFSGDKGGETGARTRACCCLVM
ncbi:uncharacterized protein SETTUDRAFT_36754 [Exserohilum turcica Et28A]|uniref:Uncharacterized protein n=1 Tax=Exserohilum turcicum (strain 28A) TaxID=671987 RepID=R0J004_EXST2|nr:uncharacterized protein SETTUDRAFT_36754 [Exserohilum turcica Et28A]EOA90101.1 hypothetical protein SETTUDRAFT_36754 [Exserohilum turcica Et28A]